MKEVLLSKGKIALVDDAVFDFINQWNWQFSSSGYAQRSVWCKESKKTKCVLMHRVIWECVNEDIPCGTEIDHINQNKLDNQSFNLRLADRSLNTFNTRKAVFNVPGIEYTPTGRAGGTTYARAKPYRLRFTHEGKRQDFGWFETPEEAEARYKEIKGLK